VVEEKEVLMKKLGKKQLSLYLQEPLQRIPSTLSDYNLELQNEGNELVYTFNTQKEHTGIASLLKKLNEHNIDIKDLNSSESSLEEIFVSLVKNK
jgi:ABC-2 type transport system ATP-binding protein